MSRRYQCDVVGCREMSERIGSVSISTLKGNIERDVCREHMAVLLKMFGVDEAGNKL